MPNAYLEFCKVVECRDDEERDWFHEQLDTVFVPDPRAADDDRLWPELDAVPESQPVVELTRFLVEFPDQDVGHDDPGFVWDFDDVGRSVLFRADEAGEPDRFGYLLHRFVATFRPRECLAFTWAAVCDRAVDGGFDGGAIVATFKGWAGTSGSEWARERTRRWKVSEGEPWSNHEEFPRDDWTVEVTAGDTLLGYWDWVVERLDEQRSTARFESHQPEHEGDQ